MSGIPNKQLTHCGCEPAMDHMADSIATMIQNASGQYHYVIVIAKECPLAGGVLKSIATSSMPTDVARQVCSELFVEDNVIAAPIGGVEGRA